MQSYPSSSSAPTTDIGTASDTLTVGVSGNVICLHTNSPFRRESDWERPRKVKDLKVDVKLERSAEGGWSFSLDDLKKEFEKQAITSYRGTWSGVCVSGLPSCPGLPSPHTSSPRTKGVVMLMHTLPERGV
jgi:hypothetical protein